MKFTVAGNRAGWPDLRSAGSAYLVEHDGTDLLLECGAGSTAYIADLVEVERLDAVWISHMHPDHSFDLLMLGMLVAVKRHAQLDPAPPRPLYLPAGATPTVHTVNALYGVETPEYDFLNRVFVDTFECREYQPRDRFSVGRLGLSTLPMQHSGGCSSVRITSDDGMTIAFTGDTGWCEELHELAAGVDLFVSECSLDAPDTTGHGHLCADEIGRVAARAGVGKVLITHFFDLPQEELERRAEEVRAHFSGPVSIARPGLQIAVS